ncbi:MULTISPECIES: glycosidase [unclassified Salinivibrio]|uniref:glycosidase n=1 Tax=unclassified Salinivibrio TaxID=2636825 RepID=UPI000985A7E6|nr:MULTISPECIES: glycosidase [unclassified Salinivibrio]OOF10328.1 glycosidase [Salinivibrio sp. PR919]OOF13651.1 glycosidase [Salinivibrio sp. PR932]
MKRSLLILAITTAVLAGCSTSDEHASTTLVKADPRFSDCNLPTIEERGPVRPSLFVVGSFPNEQWIHTENHMMGYKGDGIYQAVSDEKAGNVSLQFATMSWNPQYTAAGMEMVVGQVKELKRAGFAKNTQVSLPTDGKYVWTIQLSPDKAPLLTMVAQCK